LIKQGKIQGRHKQQGKQQGNHRGLPLQEKFITGKYEGNKWGGKYLRAPDIFFTILEKGKGKLVRLGDIADVRRGFTTGCNEFFYLTPLTSPLIKGDTGGC
jgi:multidrug efflux pump subunit AcrB